MRAYSLLLFTTLTISQLAGAQTKVPEDQFTPKPSLPQPGDKGFTQPANAGKDSQVIDEAMLRADPALLARLLDQAVMTGQYDAAAALLPLYQESPSPDQQLIRYAQAATAQQRGDIKTAINLYRDMLAEDGNLPPVRLQLAMALAADRQDAAAEDQFIRLRSDDLPPEISSIVNKELTKLQERNAWSFNFSAYYQANDNINSAPAQSQIAFGSGQLTFPEPIKAKGLHYYLSADKTFPIQGGVYSGINGSISGDAWNRSDYNDTHITAGTTLGWRDTRTDIRINPFVRRRIFAGKAYSTTAGANLNADYWVSPNWRISANTQAAHAKHDERTFLDGNQFYGGLSALYVANAGRYFFGGVSMYRNRASDPSDTYNRPSINLGWGQEWPYGVSSRLSGSLSKRHYAAPDIFNIKREDKEYSLNLNLWKRDWHFWDITPKLVLEWSKSDSNHFYYQTKPKTNAYIELSKTF